MADFYWEIVILGEFTNFDGDEYENVNYKDLADIEILATDNVFDTIYGVLNGESWHIKPKNWYSLVWFNIESWVYEDTDNNRTKSWANVTINKWDTTAFSDWISDNPYPYNADACTILIDNIKCIRKDNQNNTITTSFKDNVEYKRWESGGGNSYAPNSPDKPKYHWVWSEEDYQALENKYTEQENDTMFFTY